ncbi:MAG: hypothetical protein AAB425_04650 [Bdellovibrionota bacterium]
MKILKINAIVALLALSGCAHGMMRGTVAMKMNDQEAHVCLGDNEVKAGDKVSFFKNDCPVKGKASTDAGRECRMLNLGEGEVIRTLNEHYSLVRADAGVKFEEGTLVQKK